MNSRDEQTSFVSRETDGMLKGVNRKAGGMASAYLLYNTNPIFN